VTIRIINICGVRPNFMKVAPLMAAYKEFPEIEAILVHTGQHLNHNMSGLFFDELGIPQPDINLGVSAGSCTSQTAEIMKLLEPVILKLCPQAVLVVGDVNSTVAGALTAVRVGVKVIHVEAGLRSFDRSMPEEINRLLTDVLSDFLFVSEPSGRRNLRVEGVADERIFFVGNVMVDTLLRCRERAESSCILDRLGVTDRAYILVTLHRPSNVDNPQVLSKLLTTFGQIAERTPVVFPIHPRTRINLARFGLSRQLVGVQLIDPLGYLDFLKLMAHSLGVFTDSGGVQEETTILGVPCATLRTNTERPITVEVGTNQLVGCDPRAIMTAHDAILQGGWRVGRIPELWDGKAAQRIARTLYESNLGSERG